MLRLTGQLADTVLSQYTSQRVDQSTNWLSAIWFVGELTGYYLKTMDAIKFNTLNCTCVRSLFDAYKHPVLLYRPIGPPSLSLLNLEYALSHSKKIVVPANCILLQRYYRIDRD